MEGADRQPFDCANGANAHSGEPGFAPAWYREKTGPIWGCRKLPVSKGRSTYDRRGSTRDDGAVGFSNTPMHRDQDGRPAICRPAKAPWGCAKAVWRQCLWSRPWPGEREPAWPGLLCPWRNNRLPGRSWAGSSPCRNRWGRPLALRPQTPSTPSHRGVLSSCRLYNCSLSQVQAKLFARLDRPAWPTFKARPAPIRLFHTFQIV